MKLLWSFKKFHEAWWSASQLCKNLTKNPHRCLRSVSGDYFQVARTLLWRPTRLDKPGVFGVFRLKFSTWWLDRRGCNLKRLTNYSLFVCCILCKVSQSLFHLENCREIWSDRLPHSTSIERSPGRHSPLLKTKGITGRSCHTNSSNFSIKREASSALNCCSFNLLHSSEELHEALWSEGEF